MTPEQVRSRFLDTFAAAGFRHTPPLSLLQPQMKTSFLFSVGFIDVLEAVAGGSPEFDGAATIQRCFRHFDVERVADDRHLSLFEMGGALRCSDWHVDDLVTPLLHYLLDDCGLARDRLHVTYFGGGDVVGERLPMDHAARAAYLAAGIAEDHLWAGTPDTNIWFEGANSGTKRSGICGPHSEVFFDLSPETGSDTANPLNRPERFLEVSNVITITHRANEEENSLQVLPRPLVELALGMERLDMVLAGAMHVHDAPKLRTLNDAVRAACVTTGHTPFSDAAQRVVADHGRALTHLLADGGKPGPKGRGHVVRRLFGGLLNAAADLRLDARTAFPGLARVVAEIDAPLNPNLSAAMPHVLEVFDREAHRLLRYRSAAHA